MSLLSDYKIIKELGYGIYGTVYLISVPKNNNHYALKIEHIEKKDIKPNPKSFLWREINFYKKFAPKYPNQFIQMYEYDFINNCIHEQKYAYSKELFPIKTQIKLNKLAKSDYCVRKVFDLVDGDISNLIEKLTIKQIYSMIIQITWIINLLHTNNYTHGDFHVGNIGWIKTPKTAKISINNKRIPTYGYIYKLIDFGMIVNKNDIKTQKELKTFEKNLLLEKYHIIYNLTDNKFNNYLKNYSIKWDYSKIYNEFKKTEQFKMIKPFSDSKNIQMFLFDILFPTEFQKMVLQENFKETIPRKTFIPLDDIIFFIKNYQNPKKIIKYFSEKIT
jgi:serine/threonine protein kinase